MVQKSQAKFERYRQKPKEHKGEYVKMLRDLEELLKRDFQPLKDLNNRERCRPTLEEGDLPLKPRLQPV